MLFVIDLDGAFREDDWQLAYQVAHSLGNEKDDIAFSAGFTKISEKWVTLAKSRYIGNDFSIKEIGFVPWVGTSNTVAITGPRWQFDKGVLRSMMIFGGGSINWEQADNYTDLSAVLGINLQFRENWGTELNIDYGKAKDYSVKYSSFNASINSWFYTSPKWSGNFSTKFSKTYNFSREYLAFYTSHGLSIDWKPLGYLKVGTSLNAFIEGNPDNEIEEITYNARPYFSLTPFNNFSIKMYMDNLFLRSTNQLEQMIVGFLLAYNFSPKSWIYLAINDVQNRQNQLDINRNFLQRTLHVKNRA